MRQVRSGKEVGSARVSTGAGGVMTERLLSNDILWRRWWNAAATRDAIDSDSSLEFTS